MIPRSTSSPSSRRWIKRAVSVPSYLAQAAIRGYQLTLSPVLPLVLGPGFGCRFHPSCSHYALEAVKSHGALMGLWFGLRRILRCQPWHPGGFDPAPARSAPICRASPSPASPPVVSLFDLNG